jgi:signal transduction histidine kinase
MNATQHASARMCSLNVSVDVDLLLEIADDGVGLPSTYRPGVGLLSMRERAEELGGTCEIGPRRAGGTLVRALIPLVGT